MTFSAAFAQLLNPWVLFGFFGQLVFFARFLVQWLKSERRRQVVIPVSFWYLSFAGSIIILIYSIHIHDLVFMTAQFCGLFIYTRNLMLHYSHQRRQSNESAVPE